MVNLNGVIVAPLRIAPAEPEPAGQVVNLNGVIVAGGDEIQFLQTDPGTMFTGVAKRM